ncbi:hypothetical protein Q3G72_001277 [Acer saccharum]|nr:hypothetical protein Q3G72_001277 [Acer saccharum]
MHAVSARRSLTSYANVETPHPTAGAKMVRRLAYKWCLVSPIDNSFSRVVGRVSELLCWLSTRTEWSSLPYARSDLGFHYHKRLIDALEPCHRHMLSNLRYLEDLPHFGVFCERDLAHILPPRERLGSTLFSKRSLGVHLALSAPPSCCLACTSHFVNGLLTF